MLHVDVQHEIAGRRFEYTFEADAGITGVLGRSGAGKTTLLHLVAGLERPAYGSVRLNGETLLDRRGRIDVAPHRRRIGVVFQDDRLFPHYSVRGNLLYGARDAAHDGASTITFDRVVDLLGLTNLLGRRTRHLSGGERQRVAIGRALLMQPRLLLLDEPVSSIDRAHRAEILAYIRRLHEALGLSMLYVTHQISELLQLTDRLLLVDGGRSVAHGRLNEVIEDAAAWSAVHALEPVNVLAGTIESHDDRARLTTLRVGDGESEQDARLHAPLIDRPPESSLHVSIRPEDIALASHRIADISIQNQLPGRITRLTRHPDRVVVAVDVGAPLLVEISHRTVEQMALQEGGAIWCLIKVNAVTYL